MNLSARIDPGLLATIGLWIVATSLPGVVLLRLSGLWGDLRSEARAVFSFTLGLSVLLLAAHGLGLVGCGFPVVAATWLGVMGAAAVVLGADLVRRRARPAGRWASRAPWILGLFVFVLGIVTIRPFSPASDVPDHLATIRAVLTSGELEPDRVFYASGDGACPDARKGLVHVWMAAIAHWTRADVTSVWPALRPWLLLTGALAFATLARALLQGTLAFSIALAAYPLVVHGNAAWFLDTFSYPHNFDWTLIWCVIALAADEARMHGRGKLVALAVLAAALPFVHVFASVLGLASVIVLPVVSWLQRDRTRGANALRAVAVVAAATLPGFVQRLAETYCPVNPLHTEASEVFYLTRGLTLHAPGPMLERFSAAALAIALLSAGWFRSLRARDCRHGWLFGLTWAPLLVSLNPIAGAVLQPKLGYLFVRFLGIVPYPIVAAALVSPAFERTRPKPGRLVLATLVIVLALSRAPSLATIVRRGESHEPLGGEQLRAGLEMLAARVPLGETVLSDPATSYLLPALTGHRVVTTLDQHSSPGDSTIRYRLEDAVRALSPYRPLEEAVEVCTTRRARYVFLNQSFDRPFSTYFDTRTPIDDARARARLEQPGSPFEKVGEAGSCVLYALRAGGRAAAVPVFRFPTAVDPETTGAPPPEALNDWFSLIDVAVTPTPAHAGDTLEVRVRIRKERADAAATPYRLVFRGRNDLAGGHARFRGLDRLYARVLRQAGGPVLEFGSNRRPLEGRYPLGLWDVGEVIDDRFTVVLPRALVPGRYRIGVALHAERLVRNIALRDVLRPRGGIGLPVGEIEIKNGPVP